MQKKYLRICAAMFIFAFGICVCAQDLSAKNNDAMPKLTASELAKLIAQNKGKALVVDFWATWCPPCKEEIPGFINLYRKYKDKGLEIIGISLDMEGGSVVKPFAKRMGINYPLFLGGYDMNTEYKVSGLPTTLIYDKSGKLKIRHVGFASEKEFEEEILKLLK